MPFKKLFLLIIVFFLSPARSAEISYLFDKNYCATGQILAPITQEKNTLFGSPVNEIIPGFSILSVEKDQRSWAQEIAGKINEINKSVCSGKKQCSPIKDFKEIQVFNSFKIMHSLTLNSPLSVKDLILLFKKNNLEITEVPVPYGSGPVIQRKYLLNINFNKDPEDRSKNISSFSSAKEYLNYWQLYYGSVSLQAVFVEEGKVVSGNITDSPPQSPARDLNKKSKSAKTPTPSPSTAIPTKNDSTENIARTKITYSCSFPYPSNETPEAFASKYKLMYLSPNRK